MPAGDGTGPAGMGPMTGRGAGYCAGYGAPGYANPGPRMGMGWRRGRGGGWGGGWRWRDVYGAPATPGAPGYGYAPAWGAPPSPEQEVEFLRAQAEWLREQLDAITNRIEEIEQEGA